MRRLSNQILAIALAWGLNAGCANDSMTGSASDASVPDGPSGDADVTVPSNSLTVCRVTAAITPLPGGYGSGTPPQSHTFSIVIDPAAKMVTTGANGSVQQVAIVQDSEGWSTQAPIGFTLGYGGYPSLDYSQFHIRPTADGCVGSGTGVYNYQYTDLIYRKDFTVTLTGVVDKVGPAFSPIIPENHPLSFIGVWADEVMPAGTTADLLHGTDVLFRLKAMSSLGNVGVSGFSVEGKALAFGATYTLRFLPAAVDLAGNPATAAPSFTTLADPGLFAQDGFEGPLNAYLRGNVTVVDRSMVPIPTGSKALTIPPASGSSNCTIGFTVRLAVPAGATAIKFSRYTYWPSSSAASSNAFTLSLAVPNGEITWLEGSTSPLPFPSKVGLSGSVSDSYGDHELITYPLPAGTGSEVMLTVSRWCTDPPSSSSGVVIDDLRVE